MKKYFNVTGCCIPQEHYMVNLDTRLSEIRKYIDDRKYFAVNRGRQYGKTTTLKALTKYLSRDYIVVNLDFQRQMSSAKFRDEYTFSSAFAKAFLRSLKNMEFPKRMKESVKSLKKAVEEELDLVELFLNLSDICESSDKPLVLMIDEVDSAANNQVFLDFLAQLRGYYLDRENTPVFHSVILAGVHDIRNLRQKIRPDSEHKHNSPWNIAAKFDVEMSFSISDITGMLTEYENDYHTGMDIDRISQLIYDYTSGYPVLVSGLCKMIDEEVTGTELYLAKKDAWTRNGFLEAVKRMMSERNPLFESLINKLEDDEKLRNMLYTVLFNGQKIPFNPDDSVIGISAMYGFIQNENQTVVVANRIFETRLYNWFLSLEITESRMAKAGSANKEQFIKNGILDMEQILEKFIEAFTLIYGSHPDSFVEDAGRKYFMLYLRPIINGKGNYYIESRTRDNKRTDMVIDYLGKQYIIEMKIWHGEKYNREGEEQLIEYLNFHHLDTGYLLTFNFNQEKETGVRTIQIGDKTLIEAIV